MIGVNPGVGVPPGQGGGGYTKNCCMAFTFTIVDRKGKPFVQLYTFNRNLVYRTKTAYMLFHLNNPLKQFNEFDFR